MTDVPAIPNSGGPPALPSFMKNVLPDYSDMRIAPPPAMRLTVDRDGTLKVKQGKDVIHVAEDALTGIVVDWGRPRAYWAENFSGEGGPPDCSSMDGVRGNGLHIVAPGETARVPDESGNYQEATSGALTISRPCATCPHSQFVENRQACKQMVRFGLYIPTAGDYAPWLAAQSAPGGPPTPIIVSLPPTNLKAWDAHISWIQGIRFPLDGVWTKISGCSEQRGGYTVGQFSFDGSQPMDADAEFFYKEATEAQAHPVMRGIKEPGSDADYQKQV